MHPILIQFGSLTLYTYGLFLALGFLAAIGFSRKQARSQGINPDDISELFFVILVFGIVGARLLYVIINFDTFRSHPLDMVKIWEGGLVFFGGFIMAIAGAALMLTVRKLPVLKIADIISPGIALGHAIGRMGCFFAGCCYGRQCHKPFAITFTDPDSLAPLHVPLHPTQLYMVGSNLLLFLILLLCRKYRRFNGMVFFLYIILYSLFRAVIELFRGDFRGTLFFKWLSLSQGIGLIAALITLVLMITFWVSDHDDP